MTNVIWQNGTSDDWSDPAAWAGGKTPTIADAVTISAAGTYAVTISAAESALSIAIKGHAATLAIGAALDLTGSLTVAAGNTLLLAAAGTIVGGTIVAGGTQSFQGGTLDDVLYKGTLDLTAPGSSLHLDDGTVLTAASGSGRGTVNLTGGGGNLYFDGSQTFDNALVDLGANASLVSEQIGTTAPTLTLGPTLDIVQVGDGAAEFSYLETGFGLGDAIINQGTISATAAFGFFSIEATSFANQGTILVDDGDVLTIETDTIANTGSIAVTDGTLRLFGTLDNTGTISVAAGATLSLQGPVSAFGDIALAAGSSLAINGLVTTAQMLPLLHAGVHLEIDGTLDNRGETLVVGAATVTGGLDGLTLGGTLLGGTLVADGTLGFGQSPTFDGVLVEGAVDLSSGEIILTLADGTRLAGPDGHGPGTIDLTGSGDELFITGAQSLDTAILDIGGNAELRSQVATLTLGAALDLVHTTQAGGFIEGLAGAGDAIVNQGRIEATATGALLEVLTPGFVNDGTIIVDNGDEFLVTGYQFGFNQPVNSQITNLGSIAVIDGTLALLGTLVNTGSITIGAGSVLDIGGGTQFGHISIAAGSTVIVGGALTSAQLHPLLAPGLDLVIAGTLDNTGSLLALGAKLAALTVSGTLVGGTLAAGGAETFQGGTLADVLVEGPLDLPADGAALSLADGTRLAGTGGTGPGFIAVTGQSGLLEIDSTATLDTATIDLDSGSALFDVDLTGAGAILTLGAGLDLIATGGTEGLAAAILETSPYQGDGIVNQGRIEATESAGSFQIITPSFVNDGTIIVDNGSDLVLTAVGIANAGSLIVTNGSLVLAGSLANTGRISLAAGGVLELTGAVTQLGSLSVAHGSTIIIDGSLADARVLPLLAAGAQAVINGTLDNTGGTLDLFPGQIILGAGGTIYGGTIAAIGQPVFQGGTLADVTFAGTLDLSGAGEQISLSAGSRLIGTGGSPSTFVNLTGAGSVLAIVGSATLDHATIDLDNGALLTGHDPAGLGATLTLGAGLVLHQDSPAIVYLQTDGNGGDAIVNDGLIEATQSGGFFEVSTPSFENDGTIIVGSGDMLAIAASALSGSGLYEIGDDGGLELGGVLSGPADIRFTGTNATLILDQAPAAGVTLSNLLNGATIDLRDVLATDATLTDTALIVTLSDGSQLDYAATAAGANAFAQVVNGSQIVISGALPLSPDLVVGAISVPADALAGQQVLVTWTVVNQGSATAFGPWTDEIFFAADAAGDSPVVLAGHAYGGTLAAGDTLTFTAPVTIPTVGSFFVGVIADAGNDVTEYGGEGNNQLIDATPIAIGTPPSADLVVTSITPPSQGFSGQTSVISWTVTNTGDASTSAASWQDRVYLSVDQTLDVATFNPSLPDADTLLATVANPSYLAAGDSYTSTATITLPLDVSGPYYFIIVTDFGDQVIEYDRGTQNIAVSSVVPIETTPGGDLKVTSVLAPAQAFSGQPLAVSWSVSNSGQGPTDAGTWTDQILMSFDGVLDANAITLGTVEHDGVLAPGQTYTTGGTFELPVGVSGDASFFVVTDYLDAVYEGAAHAGDVGGTAATTHVALTPPPDLTVAAVSVPATAAALHELPVTFTVTNAGATTTPNDHWTDVVYLSSTPTIGDSPISAVSITHYGALDAGASYQGSAGFILPADLSGPCYVIVQTDYAQEVFQLDHANDSATSTRIAVADDPPDLVVTAFHAPASGAAGHQVQVTATIANTGRGDTASGFWTDAVVLSASGTLGAPDNIVIADIDNPTELAAGGSYTLSANVELPLALSGSYALFVVADFGQGLAESDFSNNAASGMITITQAVADLRVTDVSGPAMIAAGDTLSVGWTVANAGDAATDAGYWYDDVYLSPFPGVASGEVIGELRHVNPLAAGGSYGAGGSFVVPDDVASGTYYLVVDADAHDQVTEVTHGDAAFGSAPIVVSGTVTPVQPPMLGVTDVAVPAELLSGQAITIAYTEVNSGGAANAGYYDAIYLTSDLVLDRATAIYLGYLREPGLAAGTAIGISETFALPIGLTGIFHVFVAVDSSAVYGDAGLVGESDAVTVDLPPVVDFSVAAVTIPATATIDALTMFSYEVDNTADQAEPGTWNDALYLSADGTWSPDDTLIGEVTHTGGIAAHGSYTGTLTAALPGVNPGDYHVIVRSDVTSQSLGTNATGVSAGTLSVSVPTLTLGTPVAGTLATGAGRIYEFVVPAGETVRLSLATDVTASINNIYVRYGALPTLGVFDYSSTAEQVAAPDTTIGVTQQGTYYVLVEGNSVDGTETYSLDAATVPFSLSAITPDHGSNLGSVTITLDGAKFTADDRIAVVASDGTMRAASVIRWVSGTQIWATFDLRGLATGAYDVTIGDGPQSATLSHAFDVTSGPAGQLAVSIATAQYLKAGENGVVQVNYANIGDTDIAAPIIDLTTAQSLLFQAGDTLGSGDITFYGTSDTGPAGILQPGASGSISFTYSVINGSQHEALLFHAHATGGSNAPVDLASQESLYRPSSIDATDWHNIWAGMVAQLGTTTASLIHALSQDATTLGQVGQASDDVSTLMQLEIIQASGALTGSDLAAATDIAPGPSLFSLALSRSYDGSLVTRDAAGAFGDGWSSTYEVTAATDGLGNVAIRSPGGTEYFSRNADGSFAAENNDPATLGVVNGLYRLQRADGAVENFRADGRLASTIDRNGNTLTLSYNAAGALTGVAGADGETIAFTLNDAGRITSATDSDGQKVTYGYDATNTLLLSATGPAGTTSYTYAAASGTAQDNALITVTFADGTQQIFSYDAEGRLASQSGTGGLGQVSYGYLGGGEILITDALGHQETLRLGADGSVAQIEDPLGRTTAIGENANGDVTSVLSPGNSLTQFAYAAASQPTTTTDPLSGTAHATYAAGTGALTSVTNQIGSTISLSYDSAGNVVAYTEADGTGSTYRYAADGLLNSSTDAAGSTIRYSYDSAGDLTAKQFADGTSDTYGYDAQGNLLAATDQGGHTTAYTYDAAGRLASLTDAAGRMESYQYDAGGRLSQRTEPDGSITRYSYDAQGRLAELQDGTGTVLDKYSYDADGQLIRTDTGNGADTIYSYDAAGELTEILASNADGSVASRTDTSYDANGQVATADTGNGDWTYSYDAAGQLIHAVFASATAAIASQDIGTVYDAAGNRVSQTVNGLTTTYSTNALNQYTSVAVAGGGTTGYAYDADGRVAREITSAGTTTFSYDAQGELSAVAGPAGSFAYQYDAVGDLIATTENGTVTSYVVDPLAVSLPQGTSLGSIAQVYDGSTLSATYVYGQGLAAVAGSAGLSYVQTDDAGNVTGLSGALQDSYFYLPSGAAVQTGGTDSQPLQYNGADGVVSTADGLDYMGARFYDPATGRFLSPDPSGPGGGLNLYEYASNNPISNIDPTGFDTITINYFAGGVGHIGLKVNNADSFGFYQQEKNYSAAFGASSTGVEQSDNQYQTISDTDLTPLVPTVAVTYQVSAAQARIASQEIAALAKSDTQYNLYTNNCATTAAGILKDIGFTNVPRDIVPAGFIIPFERSPNATVVLSPDGIHTVDPDDDDDADADGSSAYVLPHDPNDITGPAGFGAEQFVPASAQLAYTIDFENAATATAPAQNVTITQQLDANLNWNSFRLTGFSFDNQIYVLPGNQPFYSERLDLTATKGYFLDVSAGVDIASGIVTWTFDTIDPATGRTPNDPTLGFLPVNDANYDGQALVTYIVQAKPGIATGAVIGAQATVVFDTQPPLATVAIANTVDAGAPTSAVQALAAVTQLPAFEVSWSGTDDAGGSGLASYTIAVSVDGGPSEVWLADTTLTNAFFSGPAGHSYAFTSQAKDNAGNQEIRHSVADAETDMPCFAAGTRIRTRGGDVAVEHLAVGDEVLTVSGAWEKLHWIGSRLTQCRRHASPRSVWPVRIAADAFARGRPSRDLLLSPDHAVFVDGVLIPIKRLVNGTTIRQVETDMVRYFHLELAQHDVLFAENLPAETYLDTGTRAAFSEAGVVDLFPRFAAHPDAAWLIWESFGYAPLVVAGKTLAAVRRKLRRRAAALKNHAQKPARRRA